jgi:hypothetical protein
VALDGGVGGVDDDLAFGPELVAEHTRGPRATSSHR